MIAEKYVQYTSGWTNILSEKYRSFSVEALEWLRKYQGKGRYHIHRSGTAVKFEYEEDAAMFILRWL